MTRESLRRRFPTAHALSEIQGQRFSADLFFHLQYLLGSTLPRKEVLPKGEEYFAFYSSGQIGEKQPKKIELFRVPPGGGVERVIIRRGGIKYIKRDPHRPIWITEKNSGAAFSQSLALINRFHNALQVPQQS